MFLIQYCWKLVFFKFCIKSWHCLDQWQVTYLIAEMCFIWDILCKVQGGVWNDKTDTVSGDKEISSPDSNTLLCECTLFWMAEQSGQWSKITYDHQSVFIYMCFHLYMWFISQSSCIWPNLISTVKVFQFPSLNDKYTLLPPGGIMSYLLLHRCRTCVKIDHPVLSLQYV